MAAYLQWGSLRFYLVAVYLPPLSPARCTALDLASELSHEEQALEPLRLLLADAPCAAAPVVVLGDLNTRVASRCPNLPDHPPRASVD